MHAGTARSAGPFVIAAMIAKRYERMVARDQQNPLSRLGQCRKTSGINRRRNCSANNFRLFARFRHRFRHQNAGQTMILNMENLPASSVGNLYTPQNLPPFRQKSGTANRFQTFSLPETKRLALSDFFYVGTTSIKSTVKSLTLVPVGPVIIKPSAAFSA